MNIFGIGGAELVIIILIMLVVAGPKRMVRWAYIMGQYVGKLRKMWEEVVDVMQEEVNAAGLDIEIPKELPTRQNMTKVVSKAVAPYTESIQKELKEAEKEVKEAQKPLQETVDEANAAVRETHKTTSQSIAAKIGANGSAKSVTQETTSETDEATQDKKAQERLEDKAEVSGFGAWSNPQAPNQQSEQKAK